jgi:uncharacterized surface protein with fasciclin (FAS1) repeats
VDQAFLSKVYEVTASLELFGGTHMSRNSRVLKTFYAGVLGLGLAGFAAACTPADDTAGTAPDQTTTEAPADTAPGTATQPQDQDEESIVDLLRDDDDFSILTQALTEAELAEILSQPGPYTVFAPTNSAFEALPEGTVNELLLPENRQILQEVLSYHVVAGEFRSDEIQSGEVPTLQGEPVAVNVEDGMMGNDITVGGAEVTDADKDASNGVVHAIDTVLLPPNVQLF